MMNLETLSGLWDRGGVVLLLLALMSVAAVTLILAKLIQFRALSDRHSPPVGCILGAAETGHPLKSERHPVTAMIRRLGEEARAGADADTLERSGQAFARQVLDRYRSHLRSLEVIAGLSPLLGLFGTVLGMIDAFQAMEAAGNQVNPAVLSGGIWGALLTTAAGLAVAMPSYAAVNLLDRRVERLTTALEVALDTALARLSGSADGTRVSVEEVPHAPQLRRTA